MTAATLPTIHSNGTGAQSLADEYLAVVRALRLAGEALDNATCNARDFYPQGHEAWTVARKERDETFRKLREVKQYADAWLEHISDHL
jgi:hypothetical protein